MSGRRDSGIGTFRPAGRVGDENDTRGPASGTGRQGTGTRGVRRAGGPRRLPVLLIGWLAAGLVAMPRAAVVINEIMAANAGFLRDADGDSPDWIELFNNGPTPVNLEGWHLTDDPDDLTRWTFPAVDLAPGSYLVVFASGKDRADPAGELHTNFRLAEAGEYLALVRPYGTTIEHAFDPGYPALRPNVSFGAEQHADRQKLIDADTPVRYLTPVDGAVDGVWQRPDFDDSAWREGLGPLGYDEAGNGGDPAAGVVVLQLDFNDDDAAGETGTADTEPGFTPLTLAELPATVDGMTIELEAVGGAALDDRDRDTPREDPPAFTQDQLYDDFVFANGEFDGAGLRLRLGGLAPETDYELTIWSFDTGSRGTRQSDWFDLTGGEERLLLAGYTFDGARPPAADGEDTFTLTVRSSAAGVIEIEGRRRGGTSHGVFLNALRLRQHGFGGMLRTDLAGDLRGRPGSLYVRAPFVVDDPTALDALVVKVRHDDGVGLWLNGRLLATDNTPATLAWNSTAPEERPDTEALRPLEIRVERPAGWLRVGRNILAAQALNTGPDDGDLLLGLELEALRETPPAPRFFQPATPGGPNGTGFLGLVGDTHFSVDRGFQDAPFAVAITTDTPGAEIRWTTNGAPPTATSGHVYTGPIPIDGTTVLRAAAFLPGHLPSGVDTQTYIFLDHVLRQPNQLPGYPTVWQANYPADYEMDPNVVNHARYGPLLKEALRAIPTLSLATAHENLWDPDHGIYVDATKSGPAWERPASIELIDTDGDTLFQIDGGVRMQGNASRDNVRTAKHSFRLVFRGEYGAGKLRHRWFPDSPVDAFDNIVLRACFTDAWTTRYSPTTPLGERYRPEDSLYLRDIWMKDSQLAMGWHSAHNTFVHLYVNGLYWGLYNVCERLDASHFAQYFGGREEDWDVIRDFNELLDGRRDDWDALMARVNQGISSEADYQAIRELVDVPNLIDYMILHIYAEAEDWPHHNWYAAHRRASADLPATKWIFMVWDQEIVLDQLYRRNRAGVNNDNSPARIYAKLREWPEFRREFADRLQKHLFHDGALTASNAVARLERRAAQIRQAIVAESARWGDAREFPIPPNPGTGETFTRDEWWEPELHKLYTNWFPGQAALTIERFRAVGLYPETAPPDFEPFGGPVPEGFRLVMTHTNRTGTIHYTLNGPDPRVYGTGGVAAEARAYREPVPLTGPTLVRARVKNGDEWSALVEATFYPPRDLSRLVLTEIHYHPAATAGQAAEETEFVELYNAADEPLDLAGLQFVQGIRFTFPQGSVLGPDAHGVLVRNPTAFAASFPDAPVLGMYEGGLDNGGETITLATPSGQPVWSVTYDDDAPWPAAADGGGFSLQRQSAAPGLPGPAGWIAAPPTPGQPLGGDDADHDGLPDAWERAHGLDPGDPADATADPDGDGRTNREEYEAGTDPHDPASRLRLRLTPAGPTVWLLEFDTQPGIAYTLETRQRLATGRWTALREFPPAEAPSTVRYAVQTAAETTRFYRVKARRP